MKEPTSNFVKVRCECKNEQIIFGNAAQPVSCLVCDKPLATPTGGRAQISATVLEVLK